MKRRIILILTVLMVFSSIIVNAETSNGTIITLNGDILEIPTEYGQSYIDGMSRMMVPVRVISESLGHTVQWESSTQTVIIDRDISLTIGQQMVKSHRGALLMETYAVLKDNRTYVPIGFVAEVLGYKVDYDSNNHIVNIITGEEQNSGSEKSSINDEFKTYHLDITTQYKYFN